MAAVVESVALPARRPAWLTPLVIAVMLILRLVVLGLVAWLLKPTPAWLDPVYQTGTYLLTLFLIFWERERLADFHIGWLAVGIILIFKPLETLYLAIMGFEQKLPMAFPGPWALTVWAAALVMTAWCFAAKPTFNKVSRGDRRWFVLGLLAGAATAAVLSVPMALQLGMLDDTMQISQPTPLFGLLFSALVFDIPYQLGYAAVSEEPLFRGFMWGWLRRVGWKDHWIWLFQSGLFMLSHIYYIGRLPYSFWIVVPVGSLVFGWLAWRSRSIATSMAAHAALNGLGMSLAQNVAFWLFR